MAAQTTANNPTMSASSYKMRKRKKKVRLPPEYRTPSTAGLEAASDDAGWGAGLGALGGGLLAALLTIGTGGMGVAAAAPLIAGGAYLGSNIGSAFGAGNQAEEEAKYFAEAAEADRKFSEWALLAQMDAEEEARQAAIDFSFREMVERNIQRVSPQHSFKPSNWRNS